MGVKSRTQGQPWCSVSGSPAWAYDLITVSKTNMATLTLQYPEDEPSLDDLPGCISRLQAVTKPDSINPLVPQIHQHRIKNLPHQQSYMLSLPAISCSQLQRSQPISDYPPYSLTTSLVRLQKPPTKIQQGMEPRKIQLELRSRNQGFRSLRIAFNAHLAHHRHLTRR